VHSLRGETTREFNPIQQKKENEREKLLLTISTHIILE
jgi:hypothetical protein